MTRYWWLVVALAAAIPGLARAEGSAAFVRFTPIAGGLVVADPAGAAPILYDRADAAVVGHAAADLADDVASVVGQRPAILTTVPRAAPTLIATVERPLPGVGRAMVIVGSDRRGTAFGTYELSRAIGVSPWIWWADVTPQHRKRLIVARGTHRFGPPSVRYRGFFLNDEDWGLQPWAARTFDPARGNLGPKTYTRVFQLLLRLKANTLWPAMHKASAPFNADPANARAADDWAIVMSASHAEPMPRNNVGEWRDGADRFDYATNPSGVAAYWRERVRANANYENLWPLGMRGIHDSGMVGASDQAGKVALLQRIITGQRMMLASETERDAASVPQLFTPYKEVLDLYRRGLTVPDDVTLVWPDDNFGYVRHMPTPAERSRRGGNGVYYHLSYLGAPLSYLWLATTNPALVQEELTRAYDHGADRFWIANVGDIKPAETRRYNDVVAGGKWRFIMAEEPADNQWRSMRISPVVLPAAGVSSDDAMPVAQADPKPPLVFEAEEGRADSGWRFVESLGRGRGTMIANREGACIARNVTIPPGSVHTLTVAVLPLYPDDGESIALDVAIDGGGAQRVAITRVTDDAA